MQFQVPQFIDTEPKIIGPFTLKQFFYIGGAGALSFLCFFIFTFVLWVIITVFLAAAAAALAFLKINAQPMPIIVTHAVKYLLGPRLYLWRRKEEIIKGATETRREKPKVTAEKESPLASLLVALTTTTHPIEQRERPTAPGFFDRFSPQKLQFQTLRRTTGERESARRVDYR